MSFKKQILKDTMIYSAANYFAMAVGIAVSLITKAILGAAGAGYWAMMKVFVSYGEYSDLGTRDALLREMPQARGSGDLVGERRSRDAAFAFTWAMAFVSAAAIIGIGTLLVRDILLRKGLWAAAVLVVVTQLYNFCLTQLRAEKRVEYLSAVIAANIVLVAAASVAGSRIAGAPGLAAGLVLSTTLSAGLAFMGLRERPSIRWSWPEIRRLVRIGLPMVALSYALITFLSIDSVMIARMIGYEALGFYTIALMAVQQVSTLGRFTHIILFPHIQERYGASGDLRASRDTFTRTTSALAHYLPVLIASVVFLVPLPVHWWLPRFIPGLGAMKILLLGYYFIAVNEMASTILYTTDRHRRLIPLYAGCALLGAAFNWAAIAAGWGIEGVALATAAAYFVFFIGVYGVAFSQILDRSECLRYLAHILGIFVYMAVLILVLSAWTWNTPLETEAVGKLLIFVAAFLPLLALHEKREGLVSTVFQVVLTKMRIPKTTHGAHV